MICIVKYITLDIDISIQEKYASIVLLNRCFAIQTLAFFIFSNLMIRDFHFYYLKSMIDFYNGWERILHSTLILKESLKFLNGFNAVSNILQLLFKNVQIRWWYNIFHFETGFTFVNRNRKILSNVKCKIWSIDPLIDNKWSIKHNMHK